MSLFLSRLTLDKRAGNAAIAPLLDPEDSGQALNAHHRLLWTAFGDRQDRARDFLWRDEGRGRFMVLSHRPPEPHPLFRPPETKEFAPALEPGDRLAFLLRANATRDRAALSRSSKEDRRGRSRRVDVVMDALHRLPEGEARADHRMRIAKEAGREWLEAQGARAGFTPETVEVEDYRAIPLRRGQGRLGLLDFRGTLAVDDPARFVERLAQGFGRARAFGCGLMLIRRAG